MPSTFLLTRPKNESLQWAEQLKCLGLKTIISPLLEINHANFNDVDFTFYSGLIVTSKQALESVENVKWLPLYAVGERTSELARQKGFNDIRMVAPTAETLVEKIQTRRFAKPLLYLSGRDTQIDIPAKLGKSGIMVDQHIAYEAKAVKKLSAEAQRALSEGQIRGVTLFSTRTAEIFHSLTAVEERVRVEAYCFSPQIADACERLGGWRSIYTSEQPNAESFATLLTSHAA